MTKIVNWFIENPIAANLLMIAMFVGGYLGYQNVKKEMFPSYADNQIDISVEYPGAAPNEVEQHISIRIEEAISDLPGIFQIVSESKQGYSRVTVFVVEGFDARELLNDIKSRVDTIDTFPDSSERPVIKQILQRQFLMWAALYGDAEHRELKEIAYRIRDEMSVLEGISDVVLIGLKNDEASIEISETTLLAYNLSFQDVAQAIRRSSVNLPAGTIQSAHGDIQIQSRSQAYDYEDLAQIVVRSNKDGSQLLLRDIAAISDGFADRNIDFTMNGKPGINLRINISDDPLLFEGTKNARKYISDLRKQLPEGIQLKINLESKNIYDSRFNLLKDNAIGGLILVYLVLMLFLRPMLAFWVVAGISSAFAGALWLLPYCGVSINMLSMFAFIMVLGIIVDDAIIVGESTYKQLQGGIPGKQAAMRGTNSVLTAITLAVLSTILFFTPMMMVPETVSIFTRSIFFVVLLCLLFSLVESVFILPSHLSHLKIPKSETKTHKLEKARAYISSSMEHFSNNQYRSALEFSLNHRATIGLIFLCCFTTAFTLVATGWKSFSIFPNVPLPQVMVQALYPEGTPYSKIEATADHIINQVYSVKADDSLLKINNQNTFIREINRELNGTALTIFVGLTADEERDISADEVAEALRARIGDLPEAQSYSINSSQVASGPEITLNFGMHENEPGLYTSAVADITSALASYPGVRNVRSNLDTGRSEIEIELKPYAQYLGISISDIAQQIRHRYYGVEVQRIPRAKEDVKVMLRYTKGERQHVHSLDEIHIRANNGSQIPLAEVANLKMVPGPSVIRRIDRKRVVQITAEVIDGYDASSIVSAMLEANSLRWSQTYSGFSLGVDDALRTQADFLPNMTWNFLKAAIVVWSLFSVAFRSLSQPFLILLALPFGFVGAVIGHIVWGINFSIFSVFGLLACSGVVVNDNLVLITRINQLRDQGYQVLAAVLQAGVDRFRPIVLTSVTTFVGLIPILFERSLQAKFLQPMVVSLSFGILFATLAALFLVPCCYFGGYMLKKTSMDTLEGYRKPTLQQSQADSATLK